MSQRRPEYQPLNRAFERRVRESFARQAAMSSMGISISALGPGWIELELRKNTAYTQQHGYIHAGILATAMDSACGYAAFSLMPADAAVLTAEFKINLLRPATDERYLVKGWVVKPGRTLAVCLANAAPGEDDDPVAMMTGTIMTVEGRAIDG